MSFFNKIKQCQRLATRYDKLRGQRPCLHQAYIYSDLAAGL